MKALLSIAVVFVLAFPLAGCVAPQEMKEAFENTTKEYQAAAQKIDALLGEVVIAKGKYDEAVAKGDPVAITAAKVGWEAASANYQNALDTGYAIKAAWEKSKKEIEDAESPWSAVWKGLGMVASLATAVLGVGAFKQNKTIGALAQGIRTTFENVANPQIVPPEIAAKVRAASGGASELGVTMPPDARAAVRAVVKG